MDSLGRTTCLTGTDTVGADFNKDGAAEAIAHVDGTAGSVSDATGAIATGTLTGQVPGLSLINNIGTTQAAYEAAQKAAFASTPTADTTADKLVDATEAQAVLTAAVGERAKAANGGTDATGVVDAKLVAANNTLAADKALAVKAVGGADAVAKYEASVAALAALKANVQADVDGATASVNTELTASATVSDAVKTIDPTLDTGAKLYTALTNIAYNADDRAKLVEAIKGLPHAASFTALANNDLAIAKAHDAIDNVTTGTAAKVAALGTVGTDYLGAITAQADAASKATNAHAADAKIEDAQKLFNNLDSLSKAAEAAKQAVGDFGDANSTKIAMHVVDGPALQADGANAKADVFYFTGKVDAVADVAVANFGIGDKLVLGNSLSYNNGALSTGDNNKGEFFLVQGKSGVQIVLETDNFASSKVAADATTGDITSHAGAAVITLTGVTLDHVSVANGVVSYV